MTWTDVADTAIKIGLGALVAGGFGYLNVRLGYARDDRAQYLKRRRDHLETVLEMVVEVENIYILQKSALETFRACKGSNAPKAEQASRDFAELDEKLFNVLAKFTNSSSVLLMLGEKAANAKLEAYHEAMGGWYECSFLDLDSFPEQEFAQHRKAIISARVDALAALASSYRSAY